MLREFIDYLKKRAENRHFAQAEFDERIDSDAYFGSMMDEGGSARSSKSNPHYHMSSTRGVRGPIDRFIVNLDNDDDDINHKRCSRSYG
ncbi:hypothetical protein PanWU01x14_248060 [Parasponia andersonii]|uniref:Uncharacterized protein n=1 Tax=Parasponia andersonii TaxID=3476 RepID=A0A2P5BDT2_PARAD|nr:hypothetical protein PanWU01x14_248060 [Parasponia andersonii]